LFDLGGLFEALNTSLGVGVDLVTIRELPPSVRARVLAEAKPI
jgi:predicted nucleotidyltransferase